MTMANEIPSPPSPQRPQSKAVAAGWLCFVIGLVLVFVSPMGMLLLYAPLFLAAFVLSIVGMAQGRIAGGLVLLLISIVVPLVSVIGVSGYRIGQALHEQDVQKKTALSKLAFEDVKGYPDGEYMYVEGKIRNNGNTSVTYVKVGVEYLDRNGTILDTDWTYAAGADQLRPSAAKSFRIMTKRDPRMTNFRYQLLNN